MMTHRGLERLLWLGAALCVAFGALATRATPVAPSDAGVLDRGVTLDVAPPESTFAAGEYVARHDPFRVDHHPASVAYSPVADGAPPPPPAPPKPLLVLRGILGMAPRWEAIMDGIPGRDGSVVVHEGDAFGSLTIKRVARDTVVVRGADTTWKLTVKQPW